MIASFLFSITLGFPTLPNPTQMEAPRLVMADDVMAGPGASYATTDYSVIPVNRDPRIRVVDYNPDQIIPIIGHTGYQMTIELEADEKIETAGIGDSSGWQVTPNGNATLLFLKPTMVSPTTNMTLITNKRRYNFALTAKNGLKAAQSSIVYVMRFRLPVEAQLPEIVSPPPLTAVPQEAWNRNYRFEGSTELVPQEVFDDGKSTFVRFSDTIETPAIFSVTNAESENLVNSAIRGPYMVIDRVSPTLVFRQGKLMTRLYNESYAAPSLGPNAPKPRAKKKRGFLGI
jgi:type IV secretion system protein VirB9